MNSGLILTGTFSLINLFALYVMARDKQKSRQNGDADRTPEGIIFFLASAFGAIGVFAGMHLFRHKTKKWYFKIGIPLLIMQNAATVYLVYVFLTAH